jgi:hypothetical protein
MKKLPFAVISMQLLYVFSIQAQNLAEGKRFELSGYLNLVSFGKNITLQSDIAAGINIFHFLNFSIGSNFGYRNHSMTMLDFISISIRKSMNRHEVRVGCVAGVYDLRLSGYQSIIPCFGGEFVYSYTILPNLSFRIKERIYDFFENRHSLISTMTLMGLCYSFD